MPKFKRWKFGDLNALGIENDFHIRNPLSFALAPFSALHEELKFLRDHYLTASNNANFSREYRVVSRALSKDCARLLDFHFCKKIYSAQELVDVVRLATRLGELKTLALHARKLGDIKKGVPVRRGLAKANFQRLNARGVIRSGLKARNERILKEIRSLSSNGSSIKDAVQTLAKSTRLKPPSVKRIYYNQNKLRILPR